MTSNVLAKNIFLIFASFCFCCYLSGVVFIFHNRNVSKNECQMTFMFEHPNYVVITYRLNFKCLIINRLLVHFPTIEPFNFQPLCFCYSILNFKQLPSNNVFNLFMQKINFPENDKFPKYNLYSYSEGHLTENARNMIFNGAPVSIFFNYSSLSQFLLSRVSLKFIRRFCSCLATEEVSNNHDHSPPSH